MNIEIRCKWIYKMPWGGKTQYTLLVSNPRSVKVYWAAWGHTFQMYIYFQYSKANRVVKRIAFCYSLHLQSAKQPTITSVALCHKMFDVPWHRYTRRGTSPYSSRLVVICVVLLLFLLPYVLFVCKRVLYYCHRVTTQLQLTNIYHITSHITDHTSHITSYHTTHYSVSHQ